MCLFGRRRKKVKNIVPRRETDGTESFTKYFGSGHRFSDKKKNKYN